MSQNWIPACAGITMLLSGCGDSSRPDDVVAPPPASTPQLLSQEHASADVAAAEGAGVFGRWSVDAFGLPAYDYELDHITDPRAPRAELDGDRSAWHQLGNDAIVANAYADGSVALWSQQRMYQWVNWIDPATQHHGGGYGYLRTAQSTTSTLWLDRPAGTSPLRRFGLGYFERRLVADGIDVAEAVTAPFGDAPALVHEVTLRNTTGAQQSIAWWEYWDVNPQLQSLARVARGLAAPAFDADRKTLSVAQTGEVADTAPLTIFLAALDAPVEGFETDAGAFFGAGGRARPSAVTADAASGSLAPAAPPAVGGSTLFALRSPLTLAPGQSVTLRYVYGMAHAADIAPLLASLRAEPDTRAATARAWRDYVPHADFGAARRWLARELQWDAYMTRSASVYEELCGHHVITQGGYYQYGIGEQIAFRDPLQHMLPVIYADRELAREVLRYSLQQQPPATGAIAYGMLPLCTRFDMGTANDLDVWLMLSAVEYVLASRDLDFLDEPLGYRGGLPAPLPPLVSGSVWEHVKLAYFHQETLTPRGPAGHYASGAAGDWSDFSTVLLQMTESVLVSAQLAYLYPRLAELAELHGDLAFAATVRARAAALLQTVRGEWTGGGWYARGYAGTRQIGQGVIFGEPQPWAILAGAPDAQQAATLVGNVERFLTGRGAPLGPAVIGSAICPAFDDPGITETSTPQRDGVGDNNAVFVGGVWYAVNGWLTWALGSLDGIVPHAADKALDELERNTLKAHADAFPEAWDGVLNVDDACWAHFSTDPSQCGIGLLLTLGGHRFSGQVTHKHAWTLFDTLKLAGVEPTRDGYRIAPRLPLERWTLRFPYAGVAQAPGSLRGYLRVAQDGPLTLEIQPRGFVPGARYRASIDGVPVAAEATGRGVRIEAFARRDAALDWSLTLTPSVSAGR